MLDILLYFIAVALIIFLTVAIVKQCQEDKCPKCGNKLTANFYDNRIEEIIWECENCGTKYIIK